MPSFLFARQVVGGCVQRMALKSKHLKKDVAIVTRFTLNVTKKPRHSCSFVVTHDVVDIIMSTNRIHVMQRPDW